MPRKTITFKRNCSRRAGVARFFHPQACAGWLLASSAASAHTVRSACVIFCLPPPLAPHSHSMACAGPWPRPVQPLAAAKYVQYPSSPCYVQPRCRPPRGETQDGAGEGDRCGGTWRVSGMLTWQGWDLSGQDSRGSACSHASCLF